MSWHHHHACTAISKVLNTVRQHWQRDKADFATTPHQFYTLFKPGGPLSCWWATSQEVSRKHTVTNGVREDKPLTVILTCQIPINYPGPGALMAASKHQGLLIQNGDPIALTRKHSRGFWSFTFKWECVPDKRCYYVPISTKIQATIA